MDKEYSWYTLTLGIVHQKRPAVFGPKDVSPVAVRSFPGSQDAGMYTRKELSRFWDSILISATSRNALKKFSQNALSFQATTRARTVLLTMLLAQICLWTMWSQLATSKIGLWIQLDQSHMFSNTAEYTSPCFVFNFIIDVVVMLKHHLEITKLTHHSGSVRPF